MMEYLTPNQEQKLCQKKKEGMWMAVLSSGKIPSKVYLILIDYLKMEFSDLIVFYFEIWVCLFSFLLS